MAKRLVRVMLALIVFWLPLLPPLVHAGRMTCSHDGALQFLRAVQLDMLAQRGLWWPRWSPGMVFGYGYPLFNYYPVLSLYPILILHRVGLSLLQGWNLSLALSMLASGLTMYLWTKQTVGQRGGFVAAIAYMLAPYQLYDTYWRGTITESLTLPLMPLVLWAALRVSESRRWRYALTGALAYTSILLMHAPAALIFTLVLPFYFLMLLWRAPNRRFLTLQLAGLIVLGLGLSAFFLAPAFLERGQVQLWRASQLGGMDYTQYFLDWRDLLGPVRASDPLLVNAPWPPHSLGWAIGLLAVMGLLVTWLGHSKISDAHKRHALWASLTLVGVLAMMFPVSEPLWSRTPLLSALLPFIQFPWRFLGIGGLLAAWLAGAGVAALQIRIAHPVGRAAILGLPVILLTLGTYPWVYPRLCSMPDNPDQAYYTAYEKNLQVIGTTSFGEYLPVAAQEIPANSPLVEAMLMGQPVVRWEAPGAHILDAQDDGLNARLVVADDAPVQVIYRAFNFPGWQANLDGRSVEMKSVLPLGLMAVNVPAGRHTLTIQFRSTPLRTGSAVASGIVAFIVLALWILDSLALSHSPLSSLLPSGHPLSSTAWLGLMGLGVLLIALRFGVVDRTETLLRPSRLHQSQIENAQPLSDVVIAERLRLLGYQVRPQRVTAGELVVVDLYWAAMDQPPGFGATVRLLDENGLAWSDKSERYQALGGYTGPPPAREWPPGTYADDRHAIQVLPGTPPGSYLLVALPFNADTLTPLAVSAGQPAPGGQPGVVLTRVEVTAPAQSPAIEALDLAVRADMPVGADLSLVGYTLDRAQAAPGQTMLVTLGWLAHRQPQGDYVLRLELVSPDGHVIGQQSFAPGGEHDPTSRWTTGQIIRSQMLARIPARATSGQHTWRLTLLDSKGTSVGQTTLAPLQINAPSRVFDPPETSHRLDARLDDWVALTGFESPAQFAPGKTMSVTLVWQALQETDQDYKVFVHLLDADGRLVAQSDAVPANWTRPTAGWQAGEFVTDNHTLDLEPDLLPGEYRLVAGMYAADTGRRLTTSSGSDKINLGVVQITSAKP